MPPKSARQSEDIELLKLVGAVLENTTRKPRRRRWRFLRLKSRRLRELKLRIRRKLRRHPLIPASLAVCVAVWVCVANVAKEPPAAESAAGSGSPSSAPGSREPLRVVHVETPPMVHGPAQGLTEEHLRTLKPLSYWLEKLEDPDWTTRSEAAFELVKKSRSSRVVLPALLGILDDAHAGVRFWAADRFRVLGLYRERVRSMLQGFSGNEQLLELYEASSGAMRQAFESIIASWLADLDEGERWTGLTVCGMLGARAIRFEPALQLIERNDPSERHRRQANVMLKNLARILYSRERGSDLARTPAPDAAPPAE